MRRVVIVQARMSSTRLPAKVLEQLGGKTFLEHCLDRCRMVHGVSEVVCATTTGDDCDRIVELCRERGYAWFRGSEIDCLERYYQAAVSVGADIISRVTSDNPFVDPDIIAETLTTLEATRSDYAATHLVPKLPYGLDAEAFTFDALEHAHHHAKDALDREHVTSWMRRAEQTFRTTNVEIPGPWSRDIRLSLDTVEDLHMLRQVADNYDGDLDTAGWKDLVAFIRSANATLLGEAGS